MVGISHPLLASKCALSGEKAHAGQSDFESAPSQQIVNAFDITAKESLRYRALNSAGKNYAPKKWLTSTHKGVAREGPLKPRRPRAGGNIGLASSCAQIELDAINRRIHGSLIEDYRRSAAIDRQGLTGDMA